MKTVKGLDHPKSLRVDPNDPSLNPGYSSTMTWNPKAAARQARKALGKPILKSLAQFIYEHRLLDVNEDVTKSLRIFIKEKFDQIRDAGVTLHLPSLLFRNCQIHGTATLGDGQCVFLSYFRRDPPPLRGILDFSWVFEAGNPVKVQVSPVDLKNLRIFLEKIRPEFAPVTPWGPGVGLGNRMATLDYPAAYEAIKQYGLCASVIQASVFRELIPEKMFRRRKQLLIDLPGVGLIPAGHTGSSVQGQYVAGIVHRIQQGIVLPMVADADHIPIKGTSRSALRAVQKLIEDAEDRTLFTLDPHFCLYGGKPSLQSDPARLEKVFQGLPHDRRREILKRYLGKKFPIDCISGKGSFLICMTREEVVDSAVRFEEAVKAIAATCSMIEAVKTGRPYAVEVSVDEAPGMSEQHHFFYLASELASRGVKPFSLAPGLGFTKRDLDIKDQREFFEERVTRLASIAHRFGAVLGIHSGDGKGSATRELLARATGSCFWYKVSPDRQRNLFKTLCMFPKGSFERKLYEDIFDWTLLHVLKLSLDAQGETAQSAKEAIDEVLRQETVTAGELRRKHEDACRRLSGGVKREALLADVERIVRSPSSDLNRDPDSRLMHDYAFMYVGQRDVEGRFVHRGRFFAISDEAAKAYQREDRAYIEEMLEALGLVK